MSTSVALVDNSPKYFSDSHSVPSMDLEKAKVQSLDSEIPAQRSVAIGPRKLISDALRAELSKGEAEVLAKQLIEDAKTASKASERIAAISEVTDRTEGKAVQNIRHAGVFMVMAPGEDVLSAAFGGIAPTDDSE